MDPPIQTLQKSLILLEILPAEFVQLKPSVCVLLLWSGKYLLMESGILEFGIQLKESEIPLTIGIRNISSIDKESAIQFLESKTVPYDYSARWPAEYHD